MPPKRASALLALALQEATVPKYSLLFIDADETIGTSKQIECSTDEQVTNMARQEIGSYRAIQIWDGERPVCLVGDPRNGINVNAQTPRWPNHAGATGLGNGLHRRG
jgi:hypothetical protein